MKILDIRSYKFTKDPTEYVEDAGNQIENLFKELGLTVRFTDEARNEYRGQPIITDFSALTIIRAEKAIYAQIMDGIEAGDYYGLSPDDFVSYRIAWLRFDTNRNLQFCKRSGLYNWGSCRSVNTPDGGSVVIPEEVLNSENNSIDNTVVEA